MGSYCPLAAAAPTACERATFGEAEGLSAQEQCTGCPKGSYAFGGVRIPVHRGCMGLMSPRASAGRSGARAPRVRLIHLGDRLHCARGLLLRGWLLYQWLGRGVRELPPRRRVRIAKHDADGCRSRLACSASPTPAATCAAAHLLPRWGRVRQRHQLSQRHGWSLLFDVRASLAQGHYFSSDSSECLVCTGDIAARLVPRRAGRF